ncbi:PIN domain-containing protein [Rhodopila globiformis]|uniref:PIN domain-containing protein n=1 Tax=Rhodopila globiformis TaxID=1071 RepID=A0A2S6N6W7_RHOGL|nr:PIN domain-containing protein [Rhodopila globiformis]PPQ30350.1 hypothetical protein CCS01_19535 [Rhodopila globiformis]
MIVVDTSIWIGHLRGQGDLPQVQRLRRAFGREDIIVGDLILLEVLQGAPNETQAARTELLLRDFTVVRMLDDGIVVRAASYYEPVRISV